jgi:hypothetical protein
MVTIVRKEIETATEVPLTEHEIIINELSEKLAIQRVVNCSNCDSKNIAKEDIYRCKDCNCFHGQNGEQL